MRLSYPVWVRFNGCDRALIWQTDDGTQVTEEDIDAVLVLDGRIVTAFTTEDLTTVAARHGLELKDSDGAVQVLDDVEELLELLASEEIRAQVLDAWNLFADIARSVSATLDDTGEAWQQCYDKLFFGNNLPQRHPCRGGLPALLHGRGTTAHPRCLHPWPRHSRHSPLSQGGPPPGAPTRSRMGAAGGGGRGAVFRRRGDPGQNLITRGPRERCRHSAAGSSADPYHDPGTWPGGIRRKELR